MFYWCLSFDLFGWHLEILYKGWLDQSWWVRNHTHRPMPTLCPGRRGQSTAISICPHTDIWRQWLTKDNQESYSLYFIVDSNFFWVQIFLGVIHAVVKMSLVSTPKDIPYTSCLDFHSLSIQTFLLLGPWPASNAIHHCSYAFIYSKIEILFPHKVLIDEQTYFPSGKINIPNHFSGLY